MLLPSAIAIDETSIPYFRDYIHDGFHVEYLLFVANQYGNHLINIYAYGSFPKDFKIPGSMIQSLRPVTFEESLDPLKDAPRASPVNGVEGDVLEATYPETESVPPGKALFEGKE